MKVLKIATAGSVDDGKSTLIGRLLHDTGSLAEDQLEAIRQTSERKGYDYLDFSLATDGLVAEREQGITIDVAHIYFSTQTTSYIIADTPGHVEYTRNMVTGASTSQAAIILIDARKGVVEQTYRHFFINSLLRIREVVVAINKMDLVDFDQEVFEGIRAAFEELSRESPFPEQRITFLPISALQGDNVVHPSGRLPWYTGPTLLEHLESLDPAGFRETGPVRFPVQWVIRPKTTDFPDFRGYAGKVYGGTLKAGDAVMLLPSGNCSRIRDIFFFDAPLEAATPGSSVTLTLEDDLQLSRGDMIVKLGEAPRAERELSATLCWMDHKPLKEGARFTLQHHAQKVLSRITRIEARLSTDFSGGSAADGGLHLNEVGEVRLELAREVYTDPYREHRENGFFILIDPLTRHTAAVGFVS